MWHDVAHTSPAEMHGRIRLALSLLRHRFPETSDRIAVERALEGFTTEEIAAGEARR